MISHKNPNATQEDWSLANINTLWGSFIAQTLERVGVEEAVIAPGSRSAPLTLGLSQGTNIRTTAVIDERSAAFYALGLAKKSKRPVVLVCTSGTAPAHFYPAVIEAKLSKVPLIILTADRPPQMRDCHDRQTIDQLKLFGNHVLHFQDLALPSKDISLFKYLRETLKSAYTRAINCEGGGPVHLNVPFDDLLAPTEDPLIPEFLKELNLDQLLCGITGIEPSSLALDENQLNAFTKQCKEAKSGIIFLGSDVSLEAQEVAQLSNYTGFPVLVDASSTLRYQSNICKNLVAHYDIIVRNEEKAKELTPDMIISLGVIPTSKVTRAWLQVCDPALWVIEDSTHNIDPLRLNAQYLRTSLTSVVSQLPDTTAPQSTYTQRWLELDQQVETALAQELDSQQILFEGKIPRVLIEICSEKTDIFLANSMPIRDFEFFVSKNNKQLNPYSARGANGIDGNIATAAGIAQKGRGCTLVCGDLTFLHDTNSLMLHADLEQPLTIVLVNNNGGRIFDNLPIADYEPFNQQYMVTPQTVDFASLCTAHQIPFAEIENWAQLTDQLSQTNFKGIRVLEVKTDSKNDVPLRKNLIYNIQSKLK